jgi:sugar fermentation stimulation protein A
MDVKRPSGDVETVHVANSGSMKSCLDDNCDVYTLDSHNPKRKLRHSLEIMNLKGGFACLNTQRANVLVDSLFDSYLKNYLKKDSFDGIDLFLKDFADAREYKKEAKYSKATRFDFFVDGEKSQGSWVEVKSVSMLDNGDMTFPDAVTTRGQKHLVELMDAKKMKDEAYLFFMIMRGAKSKPKALAKSFRPANEIDPDYAKLLKKAVEAGVKVRVLVAHITTTGLGVRGYFKYVDDVS